MSNTSQENRGKRWSTEEDFYLLQQVQYLSNIDIGKHLRRSENAVYSRLKKLAFHMIQNGEDPVVVQDNLKLSDDDMDQINNECFMFSRKNQPNKFITTVKRPNKKGYFLNQQQSQEIQLLMEIRSMLRRLLHLSDMKSPKNELNISEINIEDLQRKSEEFANQWKSESE